MSPLWVAKRRLFLNPSQNSRDRDTKPATQGPSTCPLWIHPQNQFLLFFRVSDFWLKHPVSSTVFTVIFLTTISGSSVHNNVCASTSGALISSSFLNHLHPSKRG